VKTFDMPPSEFSLCDNQHRTSQHDEHRVKSKLRYELVLR